MNRMRSSKRKQPMVVVIAGPNGAGKSTAAPYLLQQALGILEFVNADQIAVGLSAYAPETVSFADRWTVLDNASGTLKPIAHGTAHRTYVEEPEKWLNLKQLAQ